MLICAHRTPFIYGDIGAPLRAALTLRFHDDNEPDFLEQPFVFPPPPRSLIGERVGAYTIDSLLGKGGMGEVWLARRSDGHFKGLFAVKFLGSRLARPRGVGPHEAASMR